KSAILRSMNDALIVRVTGEENGQMRLEEIERQGLFLQRMDDTDTDRYFVCTSVFNQMLNKNRLCQIGIDIRISIAAMWIKFSNIS
ncbi:hypothetical protein MJI95_36080, partial [Salmonella enterica subsp. enterica serovar Kentucky]|nr:hypothetical protein [Salmonella enterica subsp. enterica serovar Kentucky]